MRCFRVPATLTRLVLTVAAVGMSIGLSVPARAQIVGDASAYQAILSGIPSDSLDDDVVPGDDAGTIFAKNLCKNPTFPLVCVKDGTSSTLGLKETCRKGTKPISCGTVHYRAKTNSPGLDVSFSPDPGNPTTETITAAAKLKPGTYQQVIDVKCSKVPACVGGTAPIIVLK